MMPIGRQCASGLSLLLSATRCRCSLAAHGVNGRPSGNREPMFQNGLRLATSNRLSFVRGGFALDRAATVPPTVRSFCHTPDRSGLPSEVLGVGALMLGLPWGVLGTPGVG